MIIWARRMARPAAMAGIPRRPPCQDRGHRGRAGEALTVSVTRIT
jgi:hypothetical protein